MRILLAMSGGIDSSVVAHLLSSQGHEVLGVRFTLWHDPLAPAIAQILPRKCCNAQTASRARTVAKNLGIPLHLLDLESDFKRHVVDPFLAGYASGITPNPCIGCNRAIKFGRLMECMKELDCDMLATGHYARIARERMQDGQDRFILLEAVDRTKDQSYFLYGLDQSVLSKVIFPLGSLHKQDVYALATRFHIPLSGEYRESQDLCFFPEKTPQAFLERYLSASMRPGRIVRRDGVVVGSHRGLPLYTVGQRRGLGIGGLRIPLEVVEKDIVSNTLIVAERGSEHTRMVTLRDVHFISWKPPCNISTPFHYRTHSLGAKKHGTLRIDGESATFQFDRSERIQTPGQSLVFYRDEEVVGGGVIV